MARLHIEEIVGHLELEFRQALRDAVEETMPKAKFDERELFRAFQRRAYYSFDTWAEVPDKLVKTDESA